MSVKEENVGKKLTIEGNHDMKKKVCMIVQDKMVKGGIAAVTNGYYNSVLEKDYNMIYVESYKDGSKLTKLFKAISGYLSFCKGFNYRQA